MKNAFKMTICVYWWLMWSRNTRVQQHFATLQLNESKYCLHDNNVVTMWFGGRNIDVNSICTYIYFDCTNFAKSCLRFCISSLEFRYCWYKFNIVELIILYITLFDVFLSIVQYVENVSHKSCKYWRDVYFCVMSPNLE